MRNLMIEIFRFLFRLAFFRKRYFGLYKRIIFPLNLFKGVKRKYVDDDNLVFELHLEDWIQQNIFFLGGYEKLELNLIKHSLQKGDVFVDIGANIGLYTLLASSLIGEEGKVLAFEPSTLNNERLRRNISLNKFENIVVEKVGVFDRDTQLAIYNNTKEANQGMVSSYLTEYSSSETIDAISLDNYLHRYPLPKINFIKMDIEGGEYPALLGMKNTLLKYKPTLLIEIDDEILQRTPYTSQQIFSYLKELGYKDYYIDSNGNLSENTVRKKVKNYVFINQ